MACFWLLYTRLSASVGTCLNRLQAVFSLTSFLLISQGSSVPTGPNNTGNLQGAAGCSPSRGLPHSKCSQPSRRRRRSGCRSCHAEAGHTDAQGGAAVSATPAPAAGSYANATTVAAVIATGSPSCGGRRR